MTAHGIEAAPAGIGRAGVHVQHVSFYVQL